MGKLTLILIGIFIGIGIAFLGIIKSGGNIEEEMLNFQWTLAVPVEKKKGTTIRERRIIKEEQKQVTYWTMSYY